MLSLIGGKLRNFFGGAEPPSQPLPEIPPDLVRSLGRTGVQYLWKYAISSAASHPASAITALQQCFSAMHLVIILIAAADYCGSKPPFHSCRGPG